MSDITYSIARDFSPHPGPRYARQGANSGQTFRGHLMRLLQASNGTILIDLDGTKGIGSSFLDEAFGGLVRTEGKSRDEILKRFKFQSRVDPSYIDDIIDSIRRAEPYPTTAH